MYCTATLNKYSNKLYSKTYRKLSEQQQDSLLKYIENYSKNYRQTEEYRQKQRNSHLGKHKDNGLKGHHHSTETKKLMSEKAKLSWQNNSIRKEKLIQYNYSRKGTKKGGVYEKLNKWSLSFYCKLSKEYFNKTPALLNEEEISFLDNLSQKKSRPENELYSYISSIYQGDIVRNSRKIIKNKELDIFIPKKNIAIEFDGLFWHSEFTGTNKNYHLDKTLECEKLGIRLIHIREDQWRLKQDICKSILASALGIYQVKYFARKLQFREVPKKEAKSFFEANHLHSSTNFTRAFGLYDKDILVQCVSFRRSFADKGKDLELARMASLLNTQIVGGFSKLMKHSLTELNANSCVSYIDKAVYNGSGYKGWKIVKENTGIAYHYTDFKNVYNRQQFMKKRCYNLWKEDYPDTSYERLSESQMTKDHKLYKIYDCGNIKVHFLN